MNRRQFLQFTAASTLLAGCKEPLLPAIPPWLPVSVLKPAMKEGHWLRQLKHLPPSSGERKVGTVIIGSGIAGLTAAWRLQQQGYTDFVLLMGAEPFGNASAGQWQDVSYPRGAHYLPLPTMESVHIREMLAAWQIIEANPFSTRPRYDELALVHALDERIFANQQWQDGVIPHSSANSQQQQTRFFNWVNKLKQQRGRDGKPLFTIPALLSSQDQEWRDLDKQNFATWLSTHGFTDPSLRWYLDYCCKDDYGLDSQKISAWAGLHYFASRHGQSENASESSVLTWSEGLHHLAEKMLPKTAQCLQGFAININEHSQGVDVLYSAGLGKKNFILKAQRVICATPLHVSARLLPHLSSYGFDVKQHMPIHAPWLVTNVYLDRFPQEFKGVDLAWDNVVYGSQSLGYVVDTHQWLRAAKPEYTVFTAYHALNAASAKMGREWLQHASDTELLTLGLSDLQQVYGQQLWQCARGVELTLRGHAMASPSVGFLNNRGLQALQAVDGKVLFAHSDLSGYSIFEEAAWWGWQAANRVLA